MSQIRKLLKAINNLEGLNVASLLSFSFPFNFVSFFFHLLLLHVFSLYLFLAHFTWSNISSPVCSFLYFAIVRFGSFVHLCDALHNSFVYFYSKFSCIWLKTAECAFQNAVSNFFCWCNIYVDLLHFNFSLYGTCVRVSIVQAEGEESARKKAKSNQMRMRRLKSINSFSLFVWEIVLLETSLRIDILHIFSSCRAFEKHWNAL